MTFRWGIYEKALPAGRSWRDLLSCAEAAGYQFLEISIDETEERIRRLEWTKEERRKLREALATSEVTIDSMCLSAHRKYSLGSTSRLVRERGLTLMKRAIEFAAEFGLRLVQVAGYDVFYEESTEVTRNLFLENILRCAAWAQESCVMLGLENVDNPVVDSITSALRFVQAANTPWFQLYPDVANLAAMGKGLGEHSGRSGGVDDERHPLSGRHLPYDSSRVFAVRRNAPGCPYLPGNLEAFDIRRKANGDDFGGARDPGHLNGEQPQGPYAENGYHLPRQESSFLDHSAVRVGGWIEDCGVFERNPGRYAKQCVRNAPEQLAVDPDVLGEAAVKSISEAESLRTEQVVPNGTRIAHSANIPCIVGDHGIPRLPGGHFRTNPRDHTGELVTEHDGRVKD